MRKNQVSIYIQRFTSEAPEGAVQQAIRVYADSNNIWEALAAANHEATQQIIKDQLLPSFGRAESDVKVYEEREKSCGAEKRRIELQKSAKAYVDVKEPKFLFEKDVWVVHTNEGKTEFGNAQYVAGKWLDANVCYRYHGYDSEGIERYCAKAFRFNDVVEQMLRYPALTDVSEYEEDYSKQELKLLYDIKGKLVMG